MLKRILGIVIFTVALIVVASCSTTARITEQINDVVDCALENSENMTPEQWEESNERLEELLEKYKANPEDFTVEQRRAIDRALGRYYGELVRLGLVQTWNYFNGLFERIPDFLEGFFEGLDFDELDLDEPSLDKLEFDAE